MVGGLSFRDLPGLDPYMTWGGGRTSETPWRSSQSWSLEILGHIGQPGHPVPSPGSTNIAVAGKSIMNESTCISY